MVCFIVPIDPPYMAGVHHTLPLGWIKSRGSPRYYGDLVTPEIKYEITSVIWYQGAGDSISPHQNNLAKNWYPVIWYPICSSIISMEARLSPCKAIESSVYFPNAAS